MKPKKQLKKLERRRADHDRRSWSPLKGYTRPGSQKRSGY